MLNVIALPIVIKADSSDLKVEQLAAEKRRHVLNRKHQEKSGRLSCEDEQDGNFTALEIYAAR